MPPARIPTLSADASLNARRVTCHQPRAGIWVGRAAWSPGRSGEDAVPGAPPSGGRPFVDAVPVDAVPVDAVPVDAVPVDAVDTPPTSTAAAVRRTPS